MDAMNTWGLVISNIATVLTIIGAVAAMMRVQFRAQDARIDARFDAIDARFDAIDKRFDQLDDKFTSRIDNLDKRKAHLLGRPDAA